MSLSRRFHCNTSNLNFRKIVLAANGMRSLSTVAIRPHGIFGPRDPQAVPTMVSAAKAGKNEVDHWVSQTCVVATDFN